MMAMVIIIVIVFVEQWRTSHCTQLSFYFSHFGQLQVYSHLYLAILITTMSVTVDNPSSYILHLFFSFPIVLVLYCKP